jgi:N-acetylmuramoyl-L-alanine amidase
MSFTVVIDAGHGGDDLGAVGLVKGIKEKDLNLTVAKQLAEKISQKYPDVKVVLTRDTDIFLPLQKRADIANKNHADLFISIHTNAAENRKAQGAETFILGTDRMEDNLDVAMRENAVMKLEQDQTVYQGFDPNSIESYIIFELMQNQYMDNSLLFAELVQNQFVGTLNRANRGVRQAAFWVLLKSACPSVLVEMGFISNAEEEAWLASKEGQCGIVNGIFDAFEKYYKK